MLYELWVLGGPLLHFTADPAEMVVYYKDALRVYEANQLQVLVSDEWRVFEMNYQQLREQVRTYVP